MILIVELRAAMYFKHDHALSYAFGFSGLGKRQLASLAAVDGCGSCGREKSDNASTGVDNGRLDIKLYSAVYRYSEPNTV